MLFFLTTLNHKGVFMNVSEIKYSLIPDPPDGSGSGGGGGDNPPPGGGSGDDN